MKNGTLLRWAAVLAVGAILIGLAAMAGLFGAADRSILKAVALRDGRDSAAVIEAAQFVTWLGDAGQRTIMFAILAGWLAWQRRFRAALIMLIVPPLASTTSSILKEIFARARPDVVPHLDPLSSLSFPSGHAVGAAAIAVLAALLIPAKGRPFWIIVAGGWAAAMGITRLLLGVHWPSDVVAGWLLGAAFALVGYWLALRWEPRGSGRFAKA